jgi:PhoH-like ATPase
MPPKKTAVRHKKKQPVKTFVLDTNVLLHSPVALAVFDDNQVVLPMAVLEELDKFKTQSSELGRNARESIRKLTRCARAASSQRGAAPQRRHAARAGDP